MQTASLMKGKALASANPFRDGLTSPDQSMPVRIHHRDTTVRNPPLKRRSNDNNNRRLSFASQPFLADADLDSEDSTSSGISEIFRDKSSSLMANPRLTLSAFRRPEKAIRLTKADPSRSLEAEYNLYTPDCGVLGHGAFSTVRLAIRRRDGVKVAVKSIAKHEALRSRRLRICGRTYLEEWEILRRMKDNPFTVSLLDVFENNEEIQLVTEYCEGGELFDAIQKKRNRAHAMRRGQYTETQASRITNQLLHALADLHANHIVHRDVKPENILIVNSDEATIDVKLCDFGIARVIYDNSCDDGNDGDISPLTPGRTRSFSMVGSDYYMAPEFCSGGRYDTAVDIYSLGVTLYILLCGFPPVFSGDESDEVMFPKSYWKDVSEDAKDLVRKMLLPDVAERIGAREALKHPWILRGNVYTSESRDERCKIDLVRQRLYSTLGTPSTPPQKRPILEGIESPRKRRYERRASATLMALADLYRGVASSPSVAAITAGSLTGSPTAVERKSSFGGSTVAALSF